MEDTNSQVNKIYPAFIKAQAEFESVQKDGTVKAESKTGAITRNYSYATISSVISMIKPVLAKYNLAVIQLIKNSNFEKHITIETRLIHDSGQEIVTEYSMPVKEVEKKNWVNGQNVTEYRYIDSQALGSAITYARRYALTSFFGLSTEDDDGQLASKKDEQVKDFKQDEKPPKFVDKPKQEVKPVEPVLHDEQSKHFNGMVEALNSCKTLQELNDKLASDKFTIAHEKLTKHAIGSFQLNIDARRNQLKEV
jgi:hypothetical protein